jgi:hypothetical protein
VRNWSLTVESYRQYQTKTPKAPNNHAPAAKNGLMILWPDRSSAKTANAKASVVTERSGQTELHAVRGRLDRDSSPTA